MHLLTLFVYCLCALKCSVCRVSHHTLMVVAMRRHEEQENSRAPVPGAEERGHAGEADAGAAVGAL